MCVHICINSPVYIHGLTMVDLVGEGRRVWVACMMLSSNLIVAIVHQKNYAHPQLGKDICFTPIHLSISFPHQLTKYVCSFPVHPLVEARNSISLPPICPIQVCSASEFYIFLTILGYLFPFHSPKINT